MNFIGADAHAKLAAATRHIALPRTSTLSLGVLDSGNDCRAVCLGIVRHVERYNGVR